MYPCKMFVEVKPEKARPVRMVEPNGKLIGDSHGIHFSNAPLDLEWALKNAMYHNLNTLREVGAWR